MRFRRPSILLIGLLPLLTAARPNVLLVMTDDQGYGDLGIHGNPVVKTPNLDQFARDNTQLRHFHVSPVCSPTRASLLTGRYNYRTGAVDTYLGRALMHTEETTLAELLKGAGYRTGIFGKWHLGDNFPMRPQDQGFDESLTFVAGYIGQPGDTPGNRYTDPTLRHNGKATKYRGYCSDVFTDEAIRFIGDGGDKPFFAYVPFNCPHGPYQIDETLVKPYSSIDLSPKAFPAIGFPPRPWNNTEVAKVYAMVQDIDRNFGRLLKHLADKKLADNTLVIFLTDNGPGGNRFNAGLRMGKGTVYDGGIRVPCLVRHPSFPKSQTIDTIAAHIDITPTVAAMCEVPQPQGLSWDGRNLLPILRDSKADWPARDLFFQWHRGDVPEMGRAFAVRSPTFKLVQSLGVAPSKGFNSELELFDMIKDPFEQKNLAADHPEVVADLKSRYEKWFRDVGKTRGFDPPRIRLGNVAENPSQLTRQDWRGPRAGWTPKSVGHWEVAFDRAGTYAVTLRFEPTADNERVILEVGNEKREVEFADGVREYRWEWKAMPRGNTRIGARLIHNGEQRGVESVEVEWLRAD